MKYIKFFIYNVIGAFLWINISYFIGYFLGNIEIIRNNFSIVIILIIFVSILGGFFTYIFKK